MSFEQDKGAVIRVTCSHYLNTLCMYTEPHLFLISLMLESCGQCPLTISLPAQLAGSGSVISFPISLSSPSATIL
jgi:hypothetical protein